MREEMVPIIVPETGDFRHQRAVFNPTVRMDPHTGTLHMFARGVKPDERLSTIIHIAGERDGPWSLIGEPRIVAQTENEPPDLTRHYLSHSVEDPRFLQGNTMTVVGLERPAYTPVGQRARTYLCAVDDLDRILVTRLLTPRAMPGVDGRHVLPVRNEDGGIDIFSRPQRQNEDGEYVDYFTGGPSSVYVARTSDLTQRPRDRLVFGPQEWWESRRIGGLGPMPVATAQGMLGLYMGIDGFGVYRVGAVLLDSATLRVIARTPNPLLEPTAQLDELFAVSRYGFGHEAAVVFASGMVWDADGGTIDLYCGYNDIGVVHARFDVAEVLNLMDTPDLRG